MSDKLSNAILNKIKNEHIKPLPRWHFVLRNVVFWLFFSLSAIVGGRVIGVIFFLVDEVHWDVLLHSKGGFLPPLLRLLPVFWLVSFLLFLVLASYGLQHTKRGYKINVWKLVLLNLSLSLAVGAGAFAAGDSERFEKALQKRMSFIPRVEDQRRNIWSDPDDGRLAGFVIELQSGQVLLLDDFQQQRWTINYQQAEYDHRFVIQEGIIIRIVGDQISDDLFEAEMIGPWRKPKNRR